MRVTASFGVAGVLAAAGFLYFPAMLFGFPLGGLAAALLIRRRTGSVRQLITAALMAAGGCGLMAWFVPLMLLGFREVSHQVVFLLVILGAPALLWGIGALLAMRGQPDQMSGKGRRNAVFGTSVGALLVLAGMLLLAPPVTRRFDTLYGRVLLASARATDAWDTGNRIHQANIMMGRSALRGGDLARARSCLLAAGRTPGSPQLDSFGPSMSFAREMLEAGESETVLEYLQCCRSFWKADQGRLDHWTQEIKEGRIPDFGPSL
jgi:hypothetical protein